MPSPRKARATAAVLDETCVLYIDGGTTRTRGWAAVGERVVARERVAVGARDTAREGSARRLTEALHHLVRKVGDQSRAQGQPAPTLGVAAGMITAAEGLVEVPHVEAPASALDLSRKATPRELPEVGALPIVFVPGVRSGPAEVDPEAIGASDFMRGEEVVSLGLAAQGHLPGGGVVLSLGSHWKAVRVDADGRIGPSVSTLAGEMIHAVRAHTILAGSVSRGWPETLPAEWVAAGVRRGRTDGLPRALYCVRLLDQRTGSRPEDRLAFLIGATIAASEDVLLPGTGLPSHTVALVGAPALIGAWMSVVRERGLDPRVVDEAERESAFRAGCRSVLAAGEIEARADGSAVVWRPPR
jgi:2-dehydro-3-deoxygalactonokinase